MEAFKLHFLMILPAVGALVTSFGRNSINHIPGPNAMLTQTNGSRNAERLPPIWHNLLAPLATECKDVGQVEEVYGDIRFDPVTRKIDLQGTGTGEIVQFHLYLFCLDSRGSVQNKQLQDLLQKYYFWESLVSMASKQETQGMLNDEELIKRFRGYALEYLDEAKESYSQVVDMIFSCFERDDFTF